MRIDRDANVLKALRAVFETGSLAGLSDRELLERASRRGESGRAADLAFACLVERHGPMVLRVCRSRLPDPNDADDAFQAVFCLLARRARSLWVRDSIGPWLLQVALRVSSQSRAEASRRRVFERRYAELSPRTVPPPDREPDDLGPMLLDEVGRLPDRDRSVVVLCDLQGLTHEEAAHRLGWPVGTVKSRQSRARDRLRRRLLLRGVSAEAVGAVAPLLAPPFKFAPPAVPRPLLERSVRSAMEAAAASSPAWGSSLVAGALTMMNTHRIASVASGLLLIGAAAVGVGTMVPQENEASGGGIPQRPPTGSPIVKSVQLPRVDDYLAPDDEVSMYSRTKDPDAAKDWQSPPVPESIPVTALGTAIDTAGRPVAGATVLMMFWGDEFRVLSRTTTDQAGAYRFEDVPVPVEQSPEPTRRPEVSPSTRFEIVATCPGYGLSWSPQQSMYAIDPPHPLDIQDRLPLGEPVTIDLTFRPADALSGRVVDETGTPLEGIEVSVHDADLLDALGQETSRNLNGVWKALPEGIGRASTGPDGRFQIGGLPSEACCWLWVKDPQFEHYGIALYAATTNKPIERHPRPRRSNGRGAHEIYKGNIELTLHTPRKVLVRVVGDETGEPIPEAWVSLLQPNRATGTFSGGRTDAEGTLLLAVPPEEHSGIVADPPRFPFDSRYIRTYQRDFRIPPGPEVPTFELRMRAGFEVLIEATDATTGEPLPDALFWLVPTDNPDDLRELRPSIFLGGRPSTGPDGRLRAVLAPEAGQEYRLRFAGLERPNYPAFQFQMYLDRPEYRVEPSESEPFEPVSGGSARFRFEVESLPGPGAAAVGRPEGKNAPAASATRAGGVAADPPQPDDRPGKADPDAASPPDALASERITAIVSGRATDAEGRPVAGATVFLMHDPTGSEPVILARAETVEDGSYRFDGVEVPASAAEAPPAPRRLVGGVEVVATCPGFGIAWHNRVQVEQANDDREPFDDRGRRPAEPVTMDLTFRPAEAIRGTILDEGGRPIEGVELALRGIDLIDDDLKVSGTLSRDTLDALPDRPGRVSTGPDGRFAIEGMPERALCRFNLTYPGFEESGLTIQYATVPRPDDFRLERRADRLGFDSFVGDFILTLPPPRPVSARVVDEQSGEPLPGVRLGLAWPPSGTHLPFARGATADDGTATLGLYPETYSGLRADPPEESDYLIRELRPFIVADGPAGQEVRVGLQRGFELLIEAVDAGTGGPLPDALFWLVPDDGEGEPRPIHATFQEPTMRVEPPRTPRPDGRTRVIIPPAPGERYRVWFAGIAGELPLPFARDEQAGPPRHEVQPLEGEPFEPIAGGSLRLRFEIRRLGD